MNKEHLKNDFFSFIAALNTGDPPSDTKPALHNVDWSAIVPAIEKAGMAGYISSFLAETGKEDEAPADVVENLRKKARRIAARNVLYETECANLLKGLSAAGVETILLKGFSYMQDIYGDTSARAMSDIDLLIRPADRMKALAYLLADGFSLYVIPSFKGTQNDFAHLTDITGEAHFMKKSGALSVGVDLHWKMRAEFPMNNYLDLDKLPWWENTTTAAIGDALARRLSPEMQFMHLALHFAIHHHYYGLRWFVELFLFLKAFAEKLDWEFIYQTASSNDCRKLLGVCLRLINDFFADSLPAAASWRRFLPARALVPGEYRFYKKCLTRERESRLAEYVCMPLSPATITGRLKLIYSFMFDTEGVAFWEGSGSQVPKLLHPFYVLYVVARQLLRRRN